jgi:hypothetical protein
VVADGCPEVVQMVGELLRDEEVVAELKLFTEVSERLKDAILGCIVAVACTAVLVQRVQDGACSVGTKGAGRR